MQRLWLFAASVLAAVPLALFAADPAPTKGVDLRMVDRVLAAGPTKGIDVKGALPPDRVFDLRAARQPDMNPPKKAAKGRGHKAPDPAVVAKRHADAFARHGHRQHYAVRAMTAPATFDSTTMGWVPPVRDQGQCGDCYGVEASDLMTVCFIKAGYQKADDSFKISDQYGLDSGAYHGGCDGGDGPQVYEYMKAKGFPAEYYLDSAGKRVNDYPGYDAGRHPVRLPAGAKLWRISDWGFVTSDQSDRAPTVDEVKAGIMTYGSVSFSFDAGAIEGYSGGVISRLGRNIDHEITGFVGWDDAKKAFKCRNQWGASFGEAGYFWLSYSAISAVVEPCFLTATPLPPPPPPPGPPVPPVPPGPGPNPPPVPVPGGAYTGTITTTIVKTYLNGAETGRTETTALGAPSASIESELKDAGVSPAIILDVLQLLSDLKTKPVDKNKVFADLLKIVMDLSASPTAAEKAGGCCGEDEPVGRCERADAALAA